MKDKELRRLGRRQLLELMLVQSKRIDKLEQELSAAKEQLESRRITVERAGSLAEAAVRLSGVLEAAQQAADLYLENIQEIAKQEKEDIENRKI